MAEAQFALLHRRILQGGIAPRRARRLISELRAHYADLVEELEASGLDQTTAGQRALDQLGAQETLAKQILARPELQSWSRRWPWAIYGLTPLVLFPVLFFLTIFLMIGLVHALHVRGSEFHGPLVVMLWLIRWFALYVLPILTSTWMAILATHRRVAWGWALLAIVLLSLWGAATNVDLLPHLVGAGVGWTLNTKALALLLLRRSLPTVLAAGIITTLVRFAMRLRQPPWTRIRNEFVRSPELLDP